MFTEKNFKDALKLMNFKENSAEVYQNKFSMSVDFKNKKLSYPENLKVNRDGIKNFSQNENFVVFECVHRLLQKGYKPEDIELEKLFKLGHTQKSGRADICVYKNKKVFFIIECKTYGAEFDNALKSLKKDGGQLFSYRQQEISSEWLILYTSNFDGEKIIFDSKSISCHEEIYQSAKNVQDFFKIWSEKFNKNLADDVIFHDETVAYEIGVKPFRKKDLKDFPDTSIVNKFKEILRHNDDSAKERAFDVLLSLFICKIFDEIYKSDSQELEFQFKIGVDDEFSFEGRLRNLHKKGMLEFMNKKIYDNSDSDLDKLFFQFQDTKDNELVKAVKKMFREQKFFTSNHFSFIDIDDEELFYQNSKILHEVVDIFKYYRLIGAKNLQILGDLFEQLLDKGFKQDEGKFFTPLPITRFIWDSLPLEKIISAEKNFLLPKIIDYACGAGHFLTQGYEAIKDFAKNKLKQDLEKENKGWESEKIFGIEKDGRLAKVSKIAFFMHGANKGKIKRGNGLENYSEEGISGESFDILVSNPPYSIKDFKEHLKLANKFEILEKISKNGSEIETLFVERIAQLLKVGGIAAVILPSSILNKDGGSFTTAREIILKNFYIRAIAEFGSKTFSATGTKTNILFLEKIIPPEKFKLFADTVNRIFLQNFSSKRIDEEIFKAWLEKIHVAEDIYKKFINREVDYTFWENDIYFGEYFSAFKIIPPKTFEEKEKKSWMNQKFYEIAHSVEKEKIQYFAQTYTQTTLIISAPDDNALQEKFLGYKWSNRKGDEGIKISSGGLLYDQNNRHAENKLAAAVRKSFYGEKISIPDAQNYFYYLNLADMIDFSGVNFTKIIKLTKKIETTYSGKYPFEKLGNFIKQIRGVSYKPKDLRDELNEESILLLRANNIFEGKINHDEVQFVAKEKVSEEQIIRAGDILMSASSGSLNHVGKSAICSEKIIGETFGAFCKIIRVIKGLLPEYIAIYFSTDDYREFIRRTAAGSNINNLKNEHIDNLKIPVPPIEDQKKIVKEFSAVDEEITLQEKIISDCDFAIKNKFAEMFLDKNFPLVRIGEFSENITKGTTPTTLGFNFVENGINFIKVESISEDGKFIEENFTHITEECNEKLNRSKLEAGDILFSIAGALGRVAIVDKKILPANTNQALAIIKIKSEEKISKIYLMKALSTDFIKKQCDAMKKGIAQMNLNLQNISDLQIPIPPKELQEKFAEYVRLSEENKKTAQKRLEELRLARENLTKKYFR